MGHGLGLLSTWLTQCKKLHYFWHSNDDAEIAINDVFEQKHEDQRKIGIFVKAKNLIVHRLLKLPDLYSTRHQAIATAKATRSPIEIAALFGHASVITADRHYGKRIHGWGNNRFSLWKKAWWMY